MLKSMNIEQLTSISLHKTVKLIIINMQRSELQLHGFLALQSQRLQYT